MLSGSIELSLIVITTGSHIILPLSTGHLSVVITLLRWVYCDCPGIVLRMPPSDDFPVIDGTYSFYYTFYKMLQ